MSSEQGNIMAFIKYSDGTISKVIKSEEEVADLEKLAKEKEVKDKSEKK